MNSLSQLIADRKLGLYNAVTYRRVNHNDGTTFANCRSSALPVPYPVKRYSRASVAALGIFAEPLLLQAYTSR